MSKNESDVDEGANGDGEERSMSPFEQHDYEPEDLLGTVFFAYKKGDGDDMPMLVWDMAGNIQGGLNLELAAHLRSYAEHLENQYWQWVRDTQGDSAELALEKEDDRTYR